MHILTKIFIVLVTLLAIFMVPLVVVSATNQEHWKSEAMSFSQSHRLISSQLPPLFESCGTALPGPF